MRFDQLRKGTEIGMVRRAHQAVKNRFRRQHVRLHCKKLLKDWFPVDEPALADTVGH